MSQKDYYDIGRAINQFIQDLKNAPVGGFTNVKNGVDEAARQFKDEVKNAAKGFKVEINPGVRTQPKEPPRSNQQWNSQGSSTNSWQKPAIYLQKKSIPGRTAGILFTVFGWIGLVPSAIVLLTLLSVGLTESNTGTLLTSTLILVPIIAAFLFMICKGNSLLARVRRFLRYRTFLKGSSFASIEHLAAFSGRQKDFVVKDLKKMIQNGMFEQAFLDEEETCIMLDRDTLSLIHICAGFHAGAPHNGFRADNGKDGDIGCFGNSGMGGIGYGDGSSSNFPCFLQSACHRCV